MIRPLTSLRFFAAFAVFLSHLGFLANVESTEGLWDRLFYEGYAGVTFFFVLSGFILTYSYAGRLTTLARAEVFPYLAARVGRIVPTHLLTLALSLPLMALIVLNGSAGQAAHGPQGISAETMTLPLAALAGLLNVVLLQAFVPLQNVNFAFNGPSWSLGNEMLFYGLLPVLLVCVARWPQAFSGKRLFRIAVVTWLFSLLAAAALRGTPVEHWFLYVNPLFRLNDFVIGSCMGLRFLQRADEGMVTIPRFRATVLEFGALALLVACVWFMPHVPQAFRYGSYYLPAMAAVIAAFAMSSGWLSLALSSRPLVYLGEISFAFYMLHQLVIRYALEALGQQPDHPVVLAIVMGVVAVVASVACHHLFETPMRLRIRRWARKKWPPQASPDSRPILTGPVV